NEPMIAPALGYMFGMHPPCVRDPARALVVARNTLLAHREMYRAAHEAATHTVEVGPVLAMIHFEPLDPGSAADHTLAQSSDRFMNEFFLAGLRDGVVAARPGDGLHGSSDLSGRNCSVRAL